jgi:hypothetical protein
MAKYKFKADRMGFRAGHVFATGEIREGVVKTLLSFNVIEKLDELDAKKDDKPAKVSGKSGRGKGSPKSGGKRSGRSDNSTD